MSVCLSGGYGQGTVPVMAEAQARVGEHIQQQNVVTLPVKLMQSAVVAPPVLVPNAEEGGNGLEGNRCPLAVSRDVQPYTHYLILHQQQIGKRVDVLAGLDALGYAEFVRCQPGLGVIQPRSATPYRTHARTHNTCARAWPGNGRVLVEVDVSEILVVRLQIHKCTLHPVVVAARHLRVHNLPIPANLLRAQPVVPVGRGPARFQLGLIQLAR
mmetsp:Transcript_21423/g.47587  ORF Transcript_21423/g.47587 Transcript_21423/m.47587 type:complete len:213 (+) Transcript_21423:2341-2979(+)